ncbi:hypothetical protein AB4624_16565 [Vibrio breoganii]|uniref:hypothetical protein n=1 Tax=Vibrio breoganii TaxID=553239 RepID=UPI0018E4D0F4|nr:hypothetical protein [Vibrio breoganii]
MKGVIDFLEDETGLTVVEYVVGAAMLVGVISAVFVTLETELVSSIDETVDDFAK